MRYALIREMDVSNGRGVGISLFVQGCHFHCEGCFNPETWDFNGGKEWTKDIEDKFFNLARRSYIRRISILGGEPLADENLDTVLHILARIKKELPDKEVWLYTGYVLDDMLLVLPTSSQSEKERYRIISSNLIDYLVDGRFEISKQDTMNKEIVFAGSTNQRIIAMKDINLYESVNRESEE